MQRVRMQLDTLALTSASAELRRRSESGSLKEEHGGHEGRPRDEHHGDVLLRGGRKHHQRDHDDLHERYEADKSQIQFQHPVRQHLTLHVVP